MRLTGITRLPLDIHSAPARTALIGAILLMGGLPLLGGLPGAVAAQALEVSTSLPAEGFIEPGTPVDIRTAAPLAPGQRLSLWVGDEDVTGLARRHDRGLRYVPGVRPLPPGESEIRVYLVSDDGWEELLQLPLRVRGALGFETSSWEPRLSLGVDGQLAQGHDPAAAAPPRSTFQDVEGELSLATEHVHRRGTITGSARLMGVSYRERALRFGELGEEAPRIDLAEYELAVASGPAELRVGHTRTGDHRHLIQNFGSRGVGVEVGVGSRVDVSGTVLGGSRMAGWDHPLGVGDPDHRVWNANLGIEAAPTPGVLRVDVGFMDGSARPRSGLDRGAVVDAETSRGVGIRVRSALLDRRLTVDAGYSHSTFDNLDDPQLSAGDALVEVERESADARYVDASVDLLRDLGLGSRSASLGIAVRYERVDPLYRSIGTHVRSDVRSNEVELRAEVAHASLRATVASSRDNLNDIRSILTSHTDRSAVILGLPLGRILGSTSAWVPRVQARLDRTHQFGEGIPENGGFNASHVPDQISTRRSVSVDWRGPWLAVGWRWDGSEQDNRQEGREDADLLGAAHSLSVEVSPLRSLTFGVDGGLETSESVERDEIEDTRNLSTRIQWRPFSRSSLSLRWSYTDTQDRAGTRERQSRGLDAQLSSAVPGLDLVDGQLLVRFSRRTSDRDDRTLDLLDTRSTWTLTTGLNLTLQR